MIPLINMPYPIGLGYLHLCWCVKVEIQQMRPTVCRRLWIANFSGWTKYSTLGVCYCNLSERRHILSASSWDWTEAIESNALRSPGHNIDIMIFSASGGKWVIRDKQFASFKINLSIIQEIMFFFCDCVCLMR